MTASDARPPNDETRATGWHRHDSGNVFRDGDCEFHDIPLMGPSRPVLVVDPAGAREKIARALWLEVGNDLTERLIDDLADAVFAALTAPEPPRVEGIVDGVVKPGGGEA